MLFFTFEKHFMENPEMNPNLLRLWWMEGVLLPLTVCNACRTAFGLFALLGKSQPKLLERRQTVYRFILLRMGFVSPLQLMSLGCSSFCHCIWSHVR